MKRMLINATQPEEVRIALVDGQKLYDLDVETPHYQKKKANIYKGVVTRIEPSLEAAFVDYGAERHGFLPFKEVAEEYYPDNAGSNRPSIRDILTEGQELIIQVQKEERGNKGAALTTQITLAGPYVVMMPNNPKAGGISRRIEGDERSETRDALKDLDMPEGMGLIIRTAGVGKSTEELQWGVNYLVQLWEAIQNAAKDKRGPFLIHQESDIVILAIRDYLRQDIGEIIIDDMETFHKARDFVQHVMPQQVYKVKPYQDTVPLFTRFQVESQIETAYTREVILPSGGAIVIDNTEALTSIDINSSRSTKGGDIEETAYHTNLEAACEIARQLRLRDIGGLVVIDFIDMHSNRHQRDVENKMRDAVKSDRARVQIGKISRFGLLEMSRQRLRPSIEESTQMVCPRCKGTGVIRGVHSLALSLLRLLEEEAMKENTRRVTVQLPVDVATFLLNEKRQQIIGIEDRHNLHLLIIPNEHLDTPDYLIERTRSGDEATVESSYKSKTIVPKDEARPQAAKNLIKEEPAIKNMEPSAPPAPAPQEAKPGLFKRLWKTLFESGDENTSPSEPSQTRDDSGNKSSRNGRSRPQNRRRSADQGEAAKNDKRRDNKRNQRNEATGEDAQTKGAQNDGNDNKRRRSRSRNTGRAENDQTAQSANTETKQDSSESPSGAANNGRARNQDNRGQDNRDNKSKRRADDTAKSAQNNQPDDASAPQENAPSSTTDKASGGAASERPRRRSRYNTRSFNSRRRKPEGAENMSIHSLSPQAEQTTATNFADTDADTTASTQAVKDAALSSKDTPVKETLNETLTAEAVTPSDTTAEPPKSSESSEKMASSEQAAPPTTPETPMDTETEASQASSKADQVAEPESSKSKTIAEASESEPPVSDTNEMPEATEKPVHKE